MGQYKIISKFYDLIDILYFNRPSHSPRTGILKKIPHKKCKILEVCIGTGTNSILIAENRKEADLVGIDLSKDMLEIAKNKIKEKHITNIDTKLMDATAMEFKDKEFDIVILSLVLHEVNENLRKAIIKEMKRVVKKDGSILIIEWDEPKTIFRKLAFISIKLLEPKGFKAFLNLNFTEYFSAFGLQLIEEEKYDYSRVIELKKCI